MSPEPLPLVEAAVEGAAEAQVERRRARFRRHTQAQPKPSLFESVGFSDRSRKAFPCVL